jgi:malonate transporter and related proteins
VAREHVIELLANSLVPIFIGLIFGYAAGSRKVVDNKDVKTLVSFLMIFALPCYLFVTMASTPRELLWDQAKPALVFAILYVALFVAIYYVSLHLIKDNAANSAVLALTLGFPNAAAVGIPLLLAVYGPRASVTVAVALAVGAITVTPITLAILQSGASGEENSLTQLASVHPYGVPLGIPYSGLLFSALSSRSSSSTCQFIWRRAWSFWVRRPKAQRCS